MKAFTISSLFLLQLAVAVAAGPPTARPWLGMALTLQPSPSGGKFLYVAQVGPDTPAEKAGIQAGDVITRFGSKNVAFRDQLEIIEFVSRLKIGQKLAVTLTRAGTRIDKSMIVTALPPQYESAWKETFDRAGKDRAAAKP